MDYRKQKGTTMPVYLIKTIENTAEGPFTEKDDVLTAIDADGGDELLVATIDDDGAMKIQDAEEYAAE